MNEFDGVILRCNSLLNLGCGSSRFISGYNWRQQKAEKDDLNLEDLNLERDCKQHIIKLINGLFVDDYWVQKCKVPVTGYGHGGDDCLPGHDTFFFSVTVLGGCGRSVCPPTSNGDVLLRELPPSTRKLCCTSSSSCAQHKQRRMQRCVITTSRDESWNRMPPIGWRNRQHDLVQGVCGWSQYWSRDWAMRILAAGWHSILPEIRHHYTILLLLDQKNRCKAKRTRRHDSHHNNNNNNNNNFSPPYPWV